MPLAQLILASAAVYVAVGFVFAIVFVTLGASRLDEAARRAPWSVRAIIIPGATALWPVLLAKWCRS